MCSCYPVFTWELIDASDVLFFKAPYLNQGVHRVYVSNTLFASLKECFKDVFERAVGSPTDRAIAVYQFHGRDSCAFVKRRYTLESTHTLLSLMEENPNFLRNMCHCLEGTSDSFCQYCLDNMLNSEVPYPGMPAAQLRSIVSRQTEWSPWYCSSVDATCDRNEMWLGNMAFTYPALQENSCCKVQHKEYTVYSMHYEKQKSNVYSYLCGFCHVPLRYSTVLCRECGLEFTEL